jgi:hypothetical protein
VLLGTPGYMSPEQVKSARNVDHRCDLWAVGVMFYEMVVATPAFPSDGDDPNNIWGLISAVLTKSVVPISVHDPHLAPFDAFIARALHKDIAMRYQSAREMSEDLLAISRGEAPRPSVAAATPGAFTAENRAYPINSRGELAAIPAMDEGAQHAQHAQHGQHALEQAAGRTVPSGADMQINAALSGTVPMTGSPVGLAAAVQAARGAASLERTEFAQPSPALAANVPLGGGVAGTVLAVNAPAAGLAGTVLAPGGQPSPFSTAPSGFAPPAGSNPVAPVIPPNQSLHTAGEGGGGGGMMMWIVLGVVLIAGLGAAVFWALH